MSDTEQEEEAAATRITEEVEAKLHELALLWGPDDVLDYVGKLRDRMARELGEA